MRKYLIIEGCVTMGKKEQKIDLDHIKPEEAVKYEIAKELGYLDKVKDTGWKSLTAKESGRIGGIMTKRKKELLQKEKESNSKDGIIL